MSGLVRFRWIAMVFLVIGMFPLLQWGHLRTRDIPYFILVLALLGTFNVIAQGLTEKDFGSKQKFILINLLIDLLAAVGLLFVSGSALNPFISILCIHAFLGGMLLRNKISYVFAAAVSALLGLLQFETYFDLLKTTDFQKTELALPFISQWVLILASYFVSLYFSRLLDKNEQRIRMLQDRQHQADRLKSLGALTAGFSHQMATPMNSLKLRMERGLRKLAAQDFSAKEEFEKAQGSLDECVSVFQHMASIFSHSAQADLTRVELIKLVHDLLAVWKVENPGAEVEAILTNEVLHCRIQLLAFSQTFFDLLDNAKEASTANQKVYLRLYKLDNWAQLEITDKGSGLSAEILSRLGEPFVTDKPDGNGLGLYSANMMAQAAGGEFSIYNNNSNNPAEGATARLRLPLEEQ
ncbi:sensor histidine kinase [Bdellovibrio reynosensis]|uniref:histidine kinase n=1 Tax=Bdellovibrio reynosensis TaxID=2835041 RepID=A0ABY4C7C9_9BACT|nr:HAMP domain-containing sensor histidine kinase [Bdellovibrio reynosensis]UOF00891.1 HAMP domain-containing histidine kinase [Bdellovibrio reynosensis]